MSKKNLIVGPPTLTLHTHTYHLCVKDTDTAIGHIYSSSPDHKHTIFKYMFMLLSRQPLTSKGRGSWTIAPSSPPPDQARPGGRRVRRSVPTPVHGWTWSVSPWLQRPMSPWKPADSSCPASHRPRPLPVS